MRNCDQCGGKKWLAKINKKSGEQESHKIKIDDETEFTVLVWKCWRCAHVQHEETPFVSIPARGASILYLDIEVSYSRLFNYGLRVPSKYISSENIENEYYIICWSASYVNNDTVWSDCVSSAESKKWDDRNILSKIQRLMRSADIIAGHNVDAYDLKRLNTRLLLNGMEPVINKKTFDTLKIARSKFAFESNRLDYISQRLGFRPKDDITREDWLKIVRSGDSETLRKVNKYCRGDVEEGKRVLQRLMKYSGKKEYYGTTTF